MFRGLSIKEHHAEGAPIFNRATTVREWLSLSTNRLLTRAALIILCKETFQQALKHGVIGKMLKQVGRRIAW